MVIKNMKQLEQILMKKIEQAMILTRDEIFEVLFEQVMGYYEEYTPKQYDRTNKMLDSFKGSDVICVNGYFSFTVGWDDDYLNFTYAGNPEQADNPPINPAQGKDVLEWYNSKSHGGLAVDNMGRPFKHNWWDEGMDILLTKYGSIENILKVNLEKVGLQIV